MNVTWRPLAGETIAPGSINGLWVVGCKLFGDFTHLRIVCAGEWSAWGELAPRCGPDGLPGFPGAAGAAPFTAIPFGALIGKIGGGSASPGAAPTTGPYVAPATPPLGPARDEVFAIGAYATLALPDKALGPLFIGFNSTRRPLVVHSLTLTLEGATLA